LKDDLAELAGELPALFSKLVLHLENTGGVGLGLRRTPATQEQNGRPLHSQLIKTSSYKIKKHICVIIQELHIGPDIPLFDFFLIY